MPTEPQLSFEQPRSAFGTWLGVVLLFAVFGLFVLVVINLMPRGDKFEEKRAAARMEKLKTVSEDAASLHRYAWAEKEKRVARIPIERAMELTMAELAQKKPAPAGPIATPPVPAAPAAAQTAAPASVPPPPANSSPKATSVTGPNSEMRGQPTGAANPPNAAPGTQPGPNATPAAAPPAGAAQVPAPPNERGATPVQAPPGKPLPVPGATPPP